MTKSKQRDELGEFFFQLFRTLQWHCDATAISHAVLEAFKNSGVTVTVEWTTRVWLVKVGDFEAGHPILYEALAGMVSSLATREIPLHAPARSLHDGGPDQPDGR